MRVLVIRGMNLASLAGEFEVDFRSGPLADAGVFAISGPTGAGKSTLLDALCLALYHETPRLRDAKEQNVTIPDGSEAVSPQDPRSVLRRGTGKGYAEVEFEGNDGRHWRARWSVARAHGRADSRLQLAKAELFDVGGDVPVNGTPVELRARIAQEIGLSFSQFCRAVLLAQNDFAALLKAKQAERADLLEALTGTELFARISQLAHERAAQERQALKALEQQLAVDRPLEQDERAVLEQQLEVLGQERDQLGVRLAGLEAELAWHVQGVSLRTRADEAMRAHDEAAGALASCDDERHQLARWNEAIQLRPFVDARRQALREVAEAEAALPDRIASGASATDAQAEAASRLSGLDAELAGATTALASATPSIKTAREIDARIRETISRQQERQKDRAKAAEQKGQVATKLADVEVELATGKKTVDAWQSWRGEHSALAGSDADWPALGIALRDSAACARERDSIATGLVALEGVLAGLRKQEAAFDTEVTQAIAARDVAAANAERAHAALAGLDLAALEQRADELGRRNIAAEQAKSAGAQLHQASAELERARLAEGALAGEIEALTRALASAVAAVERAQQEQDAAELTVERTRLAADEHTRRLRELLVDGDPCAVCGATDHPAAKHPVAAVDALLEGLRRTVAQARQALASAVAVREQTQARLHTGNEKLAAGRTDQVVAAARMESACGELAQLWRTLNPGQAAPADQNWVEALPTLIAAEAEMIKSERARHAALQSASDAARQQLDALERSLREVQAKLETLRQASIRPAEAKFVTETALVEQHDRRLAELDRQLCDLGLNTGGSAAASLVVQWGEGDLFFRAARLAAEAGIRLGAEREGLAREAGMLQQRIAELDDDTTAADVVLAAKKAERASVLADADVDAYAARLELDVHNARAKREEAGVLWQSRRDAATAAAAGIERLQESRAAAVARVETMVATLGTELAQRPALALEQGDIDGLVALVEALPSDFLERREQIQRIEASERETAHARLLIGQQIDQWTVAAGSAQPEDAVRVAVTATTAERDALVGIHRVRVEEIERDNARRAAAAERLSALEAGRMSAKRWLALDELIGSADGGKFKRLAQQYTLEVLLEYANEHLQRLSPRYRLARGSEALSLLIVDGDMGDQVRGVHSLSGGETFLVSLALALGLASLSSQRVRVESLFIDEGFGSLDADTLGIAMEALDRLQAEGRRVGVISHVHDMAERIGVQVRVERTAPGRSKLTVCG